MTSAATPSPSPLTLDEQWTQFTRNRFIAMPLAGTLAWLVVGVGALFLSETAASLLLFAATGSIFYLGLLMAKFTGEDLLGKTRPGNFYDRVFLFSIIQACLVYAIAIPFFLIERSSLPLTVGILTGIMWVPFSALLRHWVGLFHGISRTALIVAVWYLFPDHRFTAVAAVIIVIYAITIVVLEKRHRSLPPV